MTTAAQILSQFQATGVQTCFHDRHINPQIYAGLNGSNWSIKDYEARGGYQALRRILGKRDRRRHLAHGEQRNQQHENGTAKHARTMPGCGGEMKASCR